MKWNEPKIGDTRWKRKFCTTPRYIGDPYKSKEKVWLCWVWVKEVYKYDRGNWVGIDWTEVWVQLTKPILTITQIK